MTKQDTTIFEKYYPKPFTNLMGCKIFSNKEMAIDFPLKMLYPFSYPFTEEQRDKIVRILNGSDENINDILEKNSAFLKYIEENTTIYLVQRQVASPFLVIRGWGSLTGAGGHNLPVDQASVIQNTFAEWVVETLIKK